jgi:hypothetical protein
VPWRTRGLARLKAQPIPIGGPSSSSDAHGVALGFC